MSALRWAPPFAQGLVRDIRVRWALQEIGQDYDVDLIAFEQRRDPPFMARQPFGQVPTFSRGGVEIFESGAILYAIALDHEELMPADPQGRIDTLTWMFAALNTVEPPMAALSTSDRMNPEPEWAETFRPRLVAQIDDRLTNLGNWLQDRDYLLGRFTVADILMATALRLIRDTDVVTRHESVAAYLQRCEARPAFKAALDQQMRDFAANAPVAA